MTTVEQLKQLFRDNFVAYFRAHVAHMNITGRNFLSDHMLLEKVYTNLYEEVDEIGELIRSLGDFVPNGLQQLILDSKVPGDDIDGDADELLREVLQDLYTVKEDYEDLLEASKEENLDQVTGYAEDQLIEVTHHIWQLESTLG